MTRSFHTSTQRPYSFEPIYRALQIRHQKPTISDKDAGKYLRVSERVVRNARLDGMDDYLADLICTRLGTTPDRIYGYESWFTPESFFAADLESGVISPPDVLPLYRTKAWEELQPS